MARHGIAVVVSVVSAALLSLAIPAAAQELQRTIQEYDTEAGVQIVYMTEEGGHSGVGVLAEGGYRLWAYDEWRLQAIGEVMLVHIGDFDALYKQVAAGARFGRLFTPRLRAFGQFQVGVQNDGFEDSNTGVVVVPGVGVSYAVATDFDAHAQFDFPAVRYSDRTFNQFRLAVGVGMPLGAR